MPDEGLSLLRAAEIASGGLSRECCRRKAKITPHTGAQKQNPDTIAHTRNGTLEVTEYNQAPSQATAEETTPSGCHTDPTEYWEEIRYPWVW